WWPGEELLAGVCNTEAAHYRGGFAGVAWGRASRWSLQLCEARFHKRKRCGWPGEELLAGVCNIDGTTGIIELAAAWPGEELLAGVCNSRSGFQKIANASCGLGKSFSLEFATSSSRPTTTSSGLVAWGRASRWSLQPSTIGRLPAKRLLGGLGK